MTIEILQEYLTKLGFSVDVLSQKKFTEALTASEKKVLKVGTAVAAVAAAVEAATIEFAYSMRKMYFDSQLAGTSVRELDNMSYAAKRVGLSAEDMNATLVELGITFKNPALKNKAMELGAVFDKNGKVTGNTIRTMVEGMMAAAHGQEWLAAKYAVNLGLSEKQFYLLYENREAWSSANKEADDLATSLNLHSQETIDNANKLAHEVDGIKKSFEGLYNYLIGFMLPIIEKVDGGLHDFTVDTINGKGMFHAEGEMEKDLLRKLGLSKGSNSGASGDWSGESNVQLGGTLPLLALIRKLEGSGDNAVSPKGAVGRNQIMPETARALGFDPTRLTDPAYNDKVATALLESLAKTYKNNLDEILVAYNASSAVRERFVKSGDNRAVLPKETRDYLAHKDRILGTENTRLGITPPPSNNVSMNLPTTINITTSDNPKAIASAVSTGVHNTYSALVRDAMGAVA